MVHQDPSHRLRGDRQEVHPPLPGHVGAAQPQVRFVDQRRRLESVIGTLVPEVAPGEGVQLPVHQGNELGEGRFIALAPGEEQPADFRALGGHGGSGQHTPSLRLA